VHANTDRDGTCGAIVASLDGPRRPSGAGRARTAACQRAACPTSICIAACRRCEV